MNNKVNYTFVGLIVLVGIVSMLGFAYWMLKPQKAKETKNYIVYFNESVLGLNLDAPVKYKGIKVGRVIRLQINPKNSEQVEVMINVLKTTPIKEDTVAKLTAQGITGLSYINLTQGSNNAAPLRVKKGEKYPVIKSAPSFFSDIQHSINSVSELLLVTLDKTNELLSKKNQKEFSKFLHESATVMAKINKTLDKKTIEHLQKSAKNIEDITAQINKTIPNISRLIDHSIAWETKIDDSFSGIKKTYTKMGVTMDKMANSFSGIQNSVEDVTVQTLPSIGSTMTQMQQTLIDVNELLEHFNRSPSDILFQKENLKRGPGEK